MIAFLLGLLKVIGMILLVLLILVLVILGIVLFWPIRYQGKGRITEEKKEASVQVSWIFKAIRFRIDYVHPQKPIISIKVLWIDVLEFLEKIKNRKAKKAESKAVHPAINLALLEDKFEDEPIKVETQPKTGEQKSPKEATNPKNQAEEELQADSEEKVPLKEKIESIIANIKGIIYNIQYYINVFQEEETKLLLKDAWSSILKILNSIRPREFQLEGEFGFATPDTTGKVYGMYCGAIRPYLYNHIKLVPNFEEQVLKGNLFLKGQITIFVIVLNTFRILFDKRLKPLINKLKNGGKQNGGK